MVFAQNFSMGVVYVLSNGRQFRRLGLDDGYCHLVCEKTKEHWRRDTTGAWTKLVDDQWVPFEPDFSGMQMYFGDFGINWKP